MDYNSFNYYRANPYAKEGFLPPIAQKNRKNANFLANLPQGEKDFIFNRRKHFRQKSSIGEYGILNHEGQFNRKQHDKLNIIDIEGSSSNPNNNPALRNKYKAQGQILKESRQLGEQVLREEERRKSMVSEEYKNNKQMFNLISGRYIYDQSPKLSREHPSFEYPNERMKFEKELEERRMYESGNLREGGMVKNPTRGSSQKPLLVAGRNMFNN